MHPATAAGRERRRQRATRSYLSIPLASALLLASTLVTLVAATPWKPATVRAEPTSGAYPLPFAWDAKGIRVASDTDSDLAPYVLLIRSITARANAWLPSARRSWRWPPLKHIYLSRDRSTLAEIERFHQYERVYGRSATPFPSRARYYESLGMICVHAEPGHDPRRVIAHETAHALSRPALGRPGIFLDEGLAETLCNWALLTTAESPEQVAVFDLGRTQRVAALMREESVPPLQELCNLSFRSFHDSSREQDHYDLAWSFCHFLAARAKGPLSEKLRDLLERISERERLLKLSYSNRAQFNRLGAEISSDSKLLDELYGIDTLEAAWRAAITDPDTLDWSVQTATWYQTGDELHGIAQLGGSGIMLARPEASSVSFRLRRPLAREQSAGVVVEYRGEDDYTLATLNRGADRVGIITREGGAWGSWEHLPLPKDFDPTEDQVSVETNGHSLIVRVGEAQIGEAPLASGLGAGRIGLFMQSRPRFQRGYSDGQVTFVDVKAR